MRADAARLVVVFSVLGATLVGCQSTPRWDWWRSAKNTPPSGGPALANTTTQPPLPSATAGPMGAPLPGAAVASNNPYSNPSVYPATPYPPATPPPAVATTFGGSPAAATPYPQTGRPAPVSWPTGPAGPMAGAPATNPPVTNGLAQTMPGAQSPPAYPTTATPGVMPAAAMSPQVGQYNSTYNQASGDALAKTAAAAPNDRYSNDGSTGDRYASNPSSTTRYDVSPASPPGDRYAQPAAQERYGDPLTTGAAAPPAGTPAPKDAGTPTVERYPNASPGLPAAPANSTLATPGLPESGKASFDRYGTGVQGDPTDDRYKNKPDPYEAPKDRYAPPADSTLPPATQPGSAPSSSPQGAPGEFFPGSIKRYSSPMSTTSNDDVQNLHGFVGTTR